MLRPFWAVCEEHDGKKSGSAGSAEGSADGENQNQGDQEENEESEGTVSLEAFNRMKADLKKERDAKKALAAEKKAREDEALKSQGKWKEAAENAEKERDEAKEISERSSSLFKNTLKTSRVIELAIKAGLRDEARDDLDLLELDDVEVEETSNGRYIIRGADKFVEQLKKKKKHWFKDASAPSFNGGGGKGSGSGGDDGKITAQKVWEAEKKFGRNSPTFRKMWDDWQKQKTSAGK